MSLFNCMASFALLIDFHDNNTVWNWAGKVCLPMADVLDHWGVLWDEIMKIPRSASVALEQIVCRNIWWPVAVVGAQRKWQRKGREDQNHKEARMECLVVGFGCGDCPGIRPGDRGPPGVCVLRVGHGTGAIRR